MQLAVLGSVVLGGGLGAGMRYLVGLGALRFLGPHFPWGTFIVNIVGSLAMGLIIGLLAHKLDMGQNMRAFLTTGILGGFTTFSAFSLDIANLYERKQAGLAALYISGSVGLGIIALFFGLYLARQFSQGI